MCLYVKEGCKPEIAKKDIVCYKIVDDWGRYWKPIYACGTEYAYSYNKVLTAESFIMGKTYPIQHLEMKDYKGWENKIRKIINEGFHARCNSKYNWSNICVIPKGTEYCLGDDNEIVAVNMIVFRSVLGYCWYRIKKLWQE